MVYAAEDAFQRLPIHWMWWPAMGGVVVGLGGLIEPDALGVGYVNIAHLLGGSVVWQTALLLLAVKAVIWAVALGSGTSGGVLAPLLIFGGCIGALASFVLPEAANGFWPLLGMAAMMGGTMRAPLTATLFAIELTGDHAAALPLLVACAMAHATTVLLLKRSILTEKIARRGLHITREYQTDPFDLAWVKDVMVRDVDTLSSSWTVGEAVDFFMAGETRHKSYPVVDGEGRLLGMVSRADILSWTRADSDIDRGTLLGILVRGSNLVTGNPEELVGQLADRMAQSGVGRVPIVDEKGRLAGLVARKDLLCARARRQAEERDHEVMLRLR
jgi:CBS domain-containing protein